MMMNFLNTKFQNIGKDSFIKLAALACLIADLLNIFYIQYYWFENRFSLEFIRNVFRLQGFDVRHLSNNTIEQYKYVLISSVSNVLIVFLGVHALIYFLFIKQKNWTKKYIGGYCLSAVILTGVELLLLIGEFSPWQSLLIISALIYLFVFKGIKFFKIQEQ